ncbi:MAG: hypothetical protein QM489_06270 [Candidatus Izemoplasma sp.]
MKKKNILMVLIILGILVYFSFNRVYSDDYYHMSMMGYYGNDSFGYIDLGLIWIGISVFVVLLLTNLPKPKVNKAQSILDYRLSKGELSIEEYNEIKSKMLGRG